MSVDDQLRALHQDGFVLMPVVLNVRRITDLRRRRFNPEVLAAATPRQRRLLGDRQEAEYD